MVLCDIGLPGMDGYQVARIFRADPALQGAFLVAVTGYALPEDLQRARDAGFERHLAKPPTFEKLAEDVDREGARQQLWPPQEPLALRVGRAFEADFALKHAAELPGEADVLCAAIVEVGRRLGGARAGRPCRGRGGDRLDQARARTLEAGAKAPK